MSEKIEPALSAEEWANVVEARTVLSSPAGVLKYMVVRDERVAAVAIGNYLLPDSDPRKITRDMVENIRAAADWIDGAYDAPSETAARKPWIAKLKGYADALESYLPPE